MAQQATKKKSNSKIETQSSLLSKEKIALVYKYDKKSNTDNKLELSTEARPEKPHLAFCIKGKSAKEKGYNNLLSAMICNIFGVTEPNVASSIFNDCVNAILDTTSFLNMPPEQAKRGLERIVTDTLSLFKEFCPRDVFELMMVSKLIILHFMSNKEFISSSLASCLETRGMHQSRAIKLSRLWLEFKEKLDKHRKPDQQITVEHVHINNSGQAIIGSQLHAGGG